MIIDTEQHITIRDFAKVVKNKNKTKGVSPQLIRHYVNQGRIKSVKVGDQVLIPKAEIKNYPPKQRKLGRRPDDAPNLPNA